MKSKSTKDSGDFPPVTAVLLRELKKRFPVETPTMDTTLADVHRMAGEQAVIRFLEAQHEQQRRKE